MKRAPQLSFGSHTSFLQTSHTQLEATPTYLSEPTCIQLLKRNRTRGARAIAQQGGYLACGQPEFHPKHPIYPLSLIGLIPKVKARRNPKVSLKENKVRETQQEKLNWRLVSKWRKKFLFEWSPLSPLHWEIQLLSKSAANPVKYWLELD